MAKQLFASLREELFKCKLLMLVLGQLVVFSRYQLAQDYIWPIGALLQHSQICIMGALKMFYSLGLV